MSFQTIRVKILAAMSYVGEQHCDRIWRILNEACLVSHIYITEVATYVISTRIVIYRYIV
jgi:hypothetical protein